MDTKERRYIASVYAKGGRLMHNSNAHTTREAAAKEVFDMAPKAKDCSTCIAFYPPQKRANAGWIPSHRDIIWHRRDSIK